MKTRVSAAALIALAVLLAVLAETGAQKKRAFLQTVDESISGQTLYSNPSRYVGKHVDLHCTVSHILSRDGFAAHCGNEPYGIVVGYDTNGLSVGQDVRVIGIVLQPFKSAVSRPGGGSALSVAVKAIYLD
jgi:hypothetical protein